MITASEAKKLVGLTPAERVELLSPIIEKLAKDKKTELKTGWMCPDEDGFWSNGGYSKTPEWNEAKKILEGYGYKVSFFYEVLSIAVNMYTSIKW